jgi:hypothetical protein
MRPGRQSVRQNLSFSRLLNNLLPRLSFRLWSGKFLIPGRF